MELQYVGIALIAGVFVIRRDALSFYLRDT